MYCRRCVYGCNFFQYPYTCACHRYGTSCGKNFECWHLFKEALIYLSIGVCIDPCWWSYFSIMPTYTTAFRNNFTRFACWGDLIFSKFQNQFCTCSAQPGKNANRDRCLKPLLLICCVSETAF